MAACSVTLKKITKKYGDKEVVKDLDLSINAGEFCVFVGPSGCGKTTSLRMIAGLEEVTSGEVLIGDRLVNDIHPKDRNIAMVFQSYALYPHMTVFDNIAFGLRIRKFSKKEIEDKVLNAAVMLGLSELLGRKPKQLSGGQRQRVAMGRAIVRDPDVFLFDEPLSNLDAKLRMQMRVELKMLQRKLSTTTVYVTHDQTEAMTLADRIAVMDAGMLQQFGAPEEVFERPENVFVASFIGTPAINLFKGEIVEENGGAFVRTSLFRYRLDAEQTKKVSKRGSKQILAGVRPSDFAVVENEQKESSFSILADVVENMGSEKYIYFNTPDGIRTALAGGSYGIRQGQGAALHIKRGRLHLFDSSGRNIFTD
ncbi:MAG: sn-glycerol-3-phosphate ABC transporter ATP-binding protein UgpC [Deltaproteobacteria bacterium]|nr:sn-glycerol-3-phosphate ABC transporter ATP-binding protein UgpC [Deltaproteobacteria bacterium]